MLTTMATAVVAAIPGERPASKLAALAVRLGVVYEGSCWRMSSAVQETLRDVAAVLGLEPPEPHEESSDLGWADLVLAAEARRQAQTAERVTTRFYRMCRGAGRQALFDGQGAVVAQLVAADLPVTPETLAWAASLEDPSVLPTEAPVDPSAVKGGARVDDARGRAGVPSAYSVRRVKINLAASLIDAGRHDHPDPHRPPPWGHDPAGPGAREPRPAAPAGRPPALRAASTPATLRSGVVGPAVPPVARLGGGR